MRAMNGFRAHHWLPSGIALFGIALLWAATAHAELLPGSIKLEKESGVPNSVPGDMADDDQSTASRNNEFVIAPLPNRSPMLGWTLAVPAMYIWSPKGSNPYNQPWVTGAMGFYAENKSRGAGLFHSMSVDGA